MFRSSTNTDVVIVRLFVTRSTAPEAPELMLDVSCSIVSFTPDAGVDLRRDHQTRANFLALNRLERIDRTRDRARVGVTAGQERNFLADSDLCLFVVERHDGWRCDDVRCGISA